MHWLYNLLHYKSLQHNKDAYKKYNVQKPLIASISSKDFPDKESRAWLDTGDSSQLAPQKEGFSDFSSSVQSKLLQWSKNGYLILDRFFDNKTCDAVNAEIEQLLKADHVRFTNRNKIMFANRKSKLVKNIADDDALKKILGFILDKVVVPFQTINFIYGSEQRAHSDSIHMTTYPLGYLIAVWVALEDTSHENGPLFYYPGSHKLPYLLNNNFNEGETALTLGNKKYSDYEDALKDLVAAGEYEKRELYAKKGDILIWHANLVHGGAPILDKKATRKSMVIHYYAKDVIKYHEITERPSLM